MKHDLNKMRWMTLLLMGIAASAEAHPGHGGLLSGLAHPWSGIDHLVAMLAVGLLAVNLKGAQRFALPVGFVFSAILGAMLPADGEFLSIAENGIAISLLVLGCGLVTVVKMPFASAWALMVLSGLCHGYAHGAEIPTGENIHAFVAGMAVSTAVLHIIGIGVGAYTTLWKSMAARFWGVLVVLVGVMSI